MVAAAPVLACAYPPFPPCPTFSLQPDVCVAAFRDTVALAGTITVDTTTHQVTTAGAMTAPVEVTTTTIGVGSDAVEVDAIIAQDVRLTANTALRAIGSRPFAILAIGSVTLDAMASIDVGAGGAGARSDCPDGAVPGTSRTAPNGGDGGGGGGFSAPGGTGTGGNCTSTTFTSGGPGGAPIPMPGNLLGGCPGAPGGMGTLPGGERGLGGGAVYIAAGKAIVLATGAVIAAAGGGGHGGHYDGAVPAGDAGGGGGGAGGMIWLDAPEVDWTGAGIIANGGGGGEGSDHTTPGTGDPNPGKDGCPGWTSTPSNGCPAGASTTGAPGGTNKDDDGSDGGAGGSLDHPMGQTSDSCDKTGGGGGGGGVGFIHIVATSKQSGTTSPGAI